MAKLLYIEASPRKDRSASISVAKLFEDEYKKSHPNDTIELVDLWHQELPHFDGEVIEAKYALMHNKPHTESQKKAWKGVEELIAKFKSADKYLISLPMWNFGIPYKLKQYIDVLVQPSYTFTVSPTEGYKGLVTGKPVTVIYARGGAYGAETGAQQLDLQKGYMDIILGFIGFKDIRSLIIEPTLAGGPEGKEKALNKAKEDAKQAAALF